MTASNLREQVIAKLDQMTDDEIRALINLMDVAKYKTALESDELPADYNEDEDISIGLFSSKTGDLSLRAKEILRNEITSRSGWTQKRD